MGKNTRRIFNRNNREFIDNALINDVKIPNITGRTNWNFVKTVNCNITGDIPQEDVQTLKNMFDEGETFWHNPSTFLDYSQTNSIVS